MVDVVADVDQLQGALDLYIRAVKTGPVSLSELRVSLMRKFEEEDRRRGTPYLAPTQQVSEQFKIEYKEHVEFLGNEEPFDSSVLDLLDDDDSDSSDEQADEGIVEEPVSRILSPFEANMSRLVGSSDDSTSVVIEESEPEEDEQEDFDDSEFDVVVEESVPEEDFDDSEFDVVEESEPEDDFDDSEFDAVEESEPEDDVEELVDSEPAGRSLFDSPVDPVEEPKPEKAVQPTKKVKKVVRRVVKRKPVQQPPTEAKPRVSADISDDLDFDIQKPVTRKPPKATSNAVQNELSNPGTVVEFVKANPNCTVKEVALHFSKKEIERSVKTGKVYVKSGRLSV